MDSKTKILTRAGVEGALRKTRVGHRVGFTSGTFDLLHAGHVQYLEEARARCDILVVGINSDASVKSYKAPGRPIIGQEERSLVAAGLQCVDFVFTFDEPNNNKNIEVLKPDFYFKAGDYSKDSLTSAPLVESYGGKVEIIPFRKGNSTSAIIERVVDCYFDSSIRFVDSPKPAPRPAVFLDRDGTLIEHVDYLHEPEKIKIIPGVIQALKDLRAKGFALIIVTNQPGIGMGYFTKEDFYKVSRAMLRILGKEGVMIDRVYFCPHSHADQCQCRKPGIELVRRAVEDLGVVLKESFFVGDMSSDIECGARAGCKTVLVGTGEAGRDGLFSTKPDFQVSALGDLAALTGKV